MAFSLLLSRRAAIFDNREYVCAIKIEVWNQVKTNVPKTRKLFDMHIDRAKRIVIKCLKNLPL